MKPIIDISSWQNPRRKCGIYQIKNTVTGDYYLGSSNDIRKRIWQHRNDLVNNKHHSPHLQRSYNKYGEGAFEFTTILLCDVEHKLHLEQGLLDLLHPVYNVAKNAAASAQGTHHSAETRAKISEGNKGKKCSEETKRRMSAATSGENNPNYGKHLPMETKAKLSAVLMGRVASEETREKMSLAMIGNTNSKGNVLTDIHKQRIANSNTGKKRSEETKRKIGLSKTGNTYRRGVKLSDETREKLSLSHLGNVPSEETRAKMSIAQKVRWQNRKAIGVN